MTKPHKPWPRRLAALAVLAAAPLAAQALPGGKEDNPTSVYFVKNNAGVDLRCRIKENGGAWQAWFPMRNGGQFFRQKGAGNQTTQIYCDKPARFIGYTLHSGERYSYLMQPDGTAALVHITTR